MYNQPNFRTNVRQDEEGVIYFTPATDFSEVFQFVDQSGEEEEGRGYAACWTFGEKLADVPFNLGGECPLNRCVLVKRPDGYNLLNKLHHAIGDGTTSFRVVNEIMRQYDLLMSGKEVHLEPAKVLPSAHELCKYAENKEVVSRMVQGKLERARNQHIMFPLNHEEIAVSRSHIPHTNHTLHAVGTEEGFSKLREMCTERGITIGCYCFAALAMAKTAVYMRKNGYKSVPEGGIPAVYLDVLANLRTRLEPQPGECFMNCIAMIDIKASVTQTMSLFDLVENIGDQLQTAYKYNEAPLFFSCKVEVETGEHSGFFNSLPEGTRSEFMPSNQMEFNYPTKYSWGEIKSVHTIGSYWCPIISNQILLFQCIGGTMCYSVVCCEGEENMAAAREVFELFVHVIENSNLISDATGVADLLDLNID